jgi:hypothetical protein
MPSKKKPDLERAQRWQLDQLRRLIDDIERNGFREVTRAQIDAVFDRARTPPTKRRDDRDRHIARHTAKNRDYPKLVADAQKRAQAFNAEERIAELERERTQLLGAIGSLHDQIKEKDREHRFRVEELEGEVARLRHLLDDKSKAPKTKRAAPRDTSPIGDTITSDHERDMRTDPVYRAAFTRQGRTKRNAKGEGVREWQVREAWKDLKRIARGDRAMGSWAEIDAAAAAARKKVRQRAKTAKKRRGR